MAIEHVRIKDFLVFKDEFETDFCPGVNVLIGLNGCGKTTLLKVLYFAIEFSKVRDVSEIMSQIAGSYLNDPYLSTFFIGNASKSILNLNFDIGLIQTEYNSELHFTDMESGNVLSLNIETNNQLSSYKILNSNNTSPKYLEFERWCKRKLNAVYIPEKDLLSNSRGLPETVEYGKASFNKTEVDIIKKARVLATSEEQPLYRKICDIIGGEPDTDGQNFYIVRNGVKIPYAMEASGFRKFGLLAILIRNEQIKPGSALFWDEPENSLNPELIPKLVEILLELSRSNVQIFLATHNEFLAKEFSVSSSDVDKLKYFSLYKEKSGSIKADTSRRFDLLKPKKLIEMSVEQYERELDKELGDEDERI
jgi:ABC-type arginine transport system ATPase subunit